MRYGKSNSPSVVDWVTALIGEASGTAIVGASPLTPKGVPHTLPAIRRRRLPEDHRYAILVPVMLDSQRYLAPYPRLARVRRPSSPRDAFRVGGNF